MHVTRLTTYRCFLPSMMDGWMDGWGGGGGRGGRRDGVQKACHATWREGPQPPASMCIMQCGGSFAWLLQGRHMLGTHTVTVTPHQQWCGVREGRKKEKENCPVQSTEQFCLHLHRKCFKPPPPTRIIMFTHHHHYHASTLAFSYRDKNYVSKVVCKKKAGRPVRVKSVPNRHTWHAFVGLLCNSVREKGVCKRCAAGVCVGRAPPATNLPIPHPRTPPHPTSMPVSMERGR